MDIRKGTLTLVEAKAMDIVAYLSSLGYEPAKIRNSHYWYHSPLRNEKTPSFKVARKLNLWYDHGIGKGGNLIDFAILYHACTVGEFLKKEHNNLSFHQPLIVGHPHQQKEAENKIKIIGVKTSLSFSLQRYLYQRRIPNELADSYLKEVTYEVNGKEYYGIGFSNDAGGYEIRNPYFKGSSSPKDITTFKNNSKAVMVFEGFIDFLSFISIYKNPPPCRCNTVVLNSLSHIEKARPFMEQHEAIHLYLDRDSAGQKCSRYALSLSNKYKDESCLYRHYKDLNDWIMNIGKGQKIYLRQNL